MPLSEAHHLWFVKLAGASIGSSISIAYLLPRTRREAALRLLTGMAVGMTFGAPVGLKIAQELHLEGELGDLQVVLMGAAAASLASWWALGALRRLFGDYDAPLVRMATKPVEKDTKS